MGPQTWRMGIRNGLMKMKRYSTLAAIAHPLAEGRAFQIVHAAIPARTAAQNMKVGPTRRFLRSGTLGWLKGTYRAATSQPIDPNAKLKNMPLLKSLGQPKRTIGHHSPLKRISPGSKTRFMGGFYPNRHGLWLRVSEIHRYDLMIRCIISRAARKATGIATNNSNALSFSFFLVPCSMKAGPGLCHDSRYIQHFATAHSELSFAAKANLRRVARHYSAFSSDCRADALPQAIVRQRLTEHCPRSVRVSYAG